MGRREGRPLLDLELNLDFDFLAVASSAQAHEPRGVRSRPESWSLLSQPGREAGQGGGEGAARAWASQEHRVSYFSRPANHGRGGGPTPGRRGHTWEAGPDGGGGGRGVPGRGADVSLAHLGRAGEGRRGAGRGARSPYQRAARRCSPYGSRSAVAAGDRTWGLGSEGRSLLAAGLKTGGNAKVRRLAWGREGTPAGEGSPPEPAGVSRACLGTSVRRAMSSRAGCLSL